MNLSVLSAAHKLMFLLIGLAAITIFVVIMWQTVPSYCDEEINGTYTRVITNIQKCADQCWRKHDYGTDLENDDCFILSVYSEDENILKQDLENEYINLYFNVIEAGKIYRLKIRYDASVPNIVIMEI